MVKVHKEINQIAKIHPSAHLQSPDSQRIINGNIEIYIAVKITLPGVILFLISFTSSLILPPGKPYSLINNTTYHENDKF